MGREHPRALGDEDERLHLLGRVLLSLHHRKHIEKTWSNEMQSMLLTHLLLEELP